MSLLDNLPLPVSIDPLIILPICTFNYAALHFLLRMTAPKTFRLVLIEPSHYDDDGYVIQWLRSSIPSNTLAALYGLVLECTKRRVLGEDVELVVELYDETNTVLSIKKII